MHRRVNTLQYVKHGSGWTWRPIPKRNGTYLWTRAESSHFYLVWREEERKRYEKAGSTPAEAMEAKRRKEFELTGRAFLERGPRIPRAKQTGITIATGVADFLEFIKNKRRPNTLSATGPSWSISASSSGRTRTSRNFSPLISTPSATSVSRRKAPGVGK